MEKFDREFLDEMRYREDIQSMNSQLNEFSTAMGDQYTNIRDIHRMHSQLEKQIEHNRNKISSFKTLIKEIDNYEDELERERKDRDFLMEQLYDEKLEYEREEENFFNDKEIEHMKGEMTGLEQDRDKTKGFMRMILMHQSKNGIFHF